MTEHAIVSHEEWLEARRKLLDEEKAFTRQRDALSARRREMPWERVEKNYRFEGPQGTRSLADLFDGRSQLLIYHFMLGPDWEEGCKSCSFWADNYNGVVVHLAHRDVTLAAISRAPLARIEAFKKRMGWTFPWYSSFGSDFNYDFQASYSPEDLAKGEIFYNFRAQKMSLSETPGMSVFALSDKGEVFHTYSCYQRGLDMLNGAYHMLDLVPKGRDEEGLRHAMAWVRHHDKYDGAVVDPKATYKEPRSSASG
ncbi:MAG TPA: thioredoxin family protein [Roseiarcus sp.]|nr:thioredoxin family protein [Roseiarcus sp.]